MSKYIVRINERSENLDSKYRIIKKLQEVDIFNIYDSNDNKVAKSIWFTFLDGCYIIVKDKDVLSKIIDIVGENNINSYDEDEKLEEIETSKYPYLKKSPEAEEWHNSLSDLHKSYVSYFQRKCIPVS